MHTTMAALHILLLLLCCRARGSGASSLCLRLNNCILNGSASYNLDSWEGPKGIMFLWFCTEEMPDYRNTKVGVGKTYHPASAFCESSVTQACTSGGFSFEVDRNIKSICIQFLTDAHPIPSFAASPNVPTVASKTETASADCNIKAPYIICLPESLLTAAAQGRGTSTRNTSVVLPAPGVTRYRSQPLVTISVSSDQCSFLEGVLSLRREDTCRLGSTANWQKIHGVCSMKRRLRSLSARAESNASTFDIRFLAAKAIVAPNRVDWGKALMADIHKNPVMLIAVLFLFAIYFLLSLWAMRKDKAERHSKNKIVVLLDNNPFDKVSFLVTLYTGSRWGAGTTADVFLQLIGQNGMSDVHCLRQPRFPLFQKGSMDCFLLTVKEDLGDIRSLRVWHNNKGPSPSWYLSRAKVENMSTRKTWFFMCRKWLALDKGGCLTERTFSVTNPKTPLPRIDYFLIDLANSLIEGHLWLSIFAPVLTGTFSRFQRLSLCFATLFLNLLAGIMFSNTTKTEEPQVHLRYLRLVALQIEWALLTMPVEMMIIAFFKYSQKERPLQGVVRQDPERNSLFLSGNLKNWRECLQKLFHSAQSRNISPLENLPGANNAQSPPRSKRTGSKGAPQNWRNCTLPERDANVTGTKEQAITASSPPVAEACQRRPPSHSSFSENCAEAGSNSQEERKPPGTDSTLLCKTTPVAFPWWCVYISWALVTAVTGLSSFFIVLYGLSYGRQTSLEWLRESAAYFIENVFLLPILGIIFFSAVSTIDPKHCENLPWLTQGKCCEFMLAGETSTDETREAHLKSLKSVKALYKQYKALEAGEIANMLKRAKNQVKAFIFTSSFIGHLLFLTLLLNFAYCHTNGSSFSYDRLTHHQFSLQLSRADKQEDIYVWVKDMFLSPIRNDIQQAFLPESWSKIVRLPRLSRVQAKGTETKCFHPQSFLNNSVIRKSHCRHKYGSDIPEKGGYAGTWTGVANQSLSRYASSYSGFTYEQNKTLWMYYSHGDLHTYGPAGYKFCVFPKEERSNSTTRLDTLQQNISYFILKTPQFSHFFGTVVLMFQINVHE